MYIQPLINAGMLCGRGTATCTVYIGLLQSANTFQVAVLQILAGQLLSFHTVAWVINCPVQDCAALLDFIGMRSRQAALFCCHQKQSVW